MRAAGQSGTPAQLPQGPLLLEERQAASSLPSTVRQLHIQIWRQEALKLTTFVGLHLGPSFLTLVIPLAP